MSLNRREFLKSSAAVAAAGAVGSQSRRKRRQQQQKQNRIGDGIRQLVVSVVRDVVSCWQLKMEKSLLSKVTRQLR